MTSPSGRDWRGGGPLDGRAYSGRWPVGARLRPHPHVSLLPSSGVANSPLQDKSRIVVCVSVNYRCVLLLCVSVCADIVDLDQVLS